VPVNAKEVTLEHRTYQVSRKNHTPSRDGLPEELIRGEMSSPKKISKERYAPRRYTLPGEGCSSPRRAPRKKLLGEKGSQANTIQAEQE
jgi:hypothetical protein